MAGVKRPKKESGAGKTPELSDADTLLVLNAPEPDSIIGRRARAILALGAYDGLRVSEVCALTVKRHAKAQGVYTHGLSFHSLRATAATKANEIGGGMKAVQEMMGHSSVATTEGYCRNRYDGEKSAVLKVNYH